MADKLFMTTNIETGIRPELEALCEAIHKGDFNQGRDVDNFARKLAEVVAGAIVDSSMELERKIRDRR